jgi:hypothetical protein
MIARNKFAFTFSKQVNYLITFFVIAFTGIPFFDDGSKRNLMLFVLFIGSMFIYRNRKISKGLIIVSLIAFLLLLTQRVIFEGGSYFTFFTFILFVIILPYMALKVLGPNSFIKAFNDIIYVFAIISIIFWTATNFVPGFFEQTYQIAGMLMPYTNWEIQESFIIYTVEFDKTFGLHRNPGPFHEPGAWAVFLILSLIFESLRSNSLFTRRGFVLIVSLVTTFSTAGYLALFILLSFYFLTNKNLSNFTKLSGFIIAIPLAVWLFVSLEFMQEKLVNQARDQMDQSLYEGTSGRFLGARKALVVLQRHALYGRGLLTATQAAAGTDEQAGYGWITWVSQLGLVFGFLYMFFLYKTIKNYAISNNQSVSYSVFAYLALLSALAGQKHASSLVFFMLFLISIEYTINKFQSSYRLK